MYTLANFLASTVCLVVANDGASTQVQRAGTACVDRTAAAKATDAVIGAVVLQNGTLAQREIPLHGDEGIRLRQLVAVEGHVLDGQGRAVFRQLQGSTS